MVFGDPTKPPRKRRWLGRFLQRSSDSTDALAQLPGVNLGPRYEQGALDRLGRQEGADRPDRN